jgi:hypothetical protein
LEAAIGDFFEGSSSNSMAVRRKSLPHQWALSKVYEHLNSFIEHERPDFK